MEKLSVIIPVYNVYPYLRQCLESIINQTYKNLEIIVVNDASPYIEDDEICREYAEKDKRIKYIIHEKNKGLGGARNTGIENAAGKYITFVDSDDYILENCAYERLINYAEKSKVDVLMFGIYLFIDGDESSKTQIYKNTYYKKAKKINNTYFPSEVAWNKLFLISSLKENKLEFKEQIKYEDIEFWYRYVITVDPKIKYIDENYYMYRQRENSIMSNSINFTKRFEIYKMIYDFIKEHNKEWEYRKNIVKWLSIPENFNTYPDNVKQIYRTNAIDFMQEIELKSEEIFNILDMQFFRMFINDEYAAEKYMEVTANYKKIKYKYVKTNLFIYKLKREIKRIISKIW